MVLSSMLVIVAMLWNGSATGCLVYGCLYSATMENHSTTDRFDSEGFFFLMFFHCSGYFDCPSSWFPCGHSEAMADCWGDDFKIYALEVLFGRACEYQRRGYCIERVCELWSPLAPWFLVLCFVIVDMLWNGFSKYVLHFPFILLFLFFHCRLRGFLVDMGRWWPIAEVIPEMDLCWSSCLGECVIFSLGIIA